MIDVGIGCTQRVFHGGSTLSSLKAAYESAYQLALENAKTWLLVAKHAFDAGNNGQAYALAVIANEEVGKAYVTWLAAMGFIPEEHPLVDKVYDNHKVKNAVTILIHDLRQIIEIVGWGIIDRDDLFKESTLNPPADEQIEQYLRERAKEIHEGRLDGMYVEIWEEDDGLFSARSPKSFPRERAEIAVDSVAWVLGLIWSLTEQVPENEELKLFLGRQLEDEWSFIDSHSLTE